MFKNKMVQYMRTRIISAFPGTGKTFYHLNHKDTTLDSDSSLFSWVYVNGIKQRNPEFPNNYINHIKENIGKYDFIFVSTHKEVRDALIHNCIYFYLVYPSCDDKEIYLNRYKKRNSPQSFIDLVSNNWLNWLMDVQSCVFGCRQIEMISGWTITDELDHMIRSESGES